MTDTAASAEHGFAEQFGRRPAGVWSAPGRVNLIGEHTDYNDGFVFPFAIDRRTAVALADRDDRVVRVASTFSPETVEVHLDGLVPDAVSGWAAYPLGVVWALGEFGADLRHVRGVDLHIGSDVPIGAGLSSSAAIECAVALALDEHWGLGFDRATLAKVGRLAENRVVGAPTGIMDQSASLLGETDAGVFLDCRSLDADVIPLGFAEAGLSLLVIDTRVSHAHATGGYAARRASCEAGARALEVESLREVRVDDLDRARDLLDDETFRRVRHVVTENQRVLDTVRTLREHGPGAIGPLLDASHASMRDDFEISVPELDLAVETAQAHGAIGARMTGGGFGGSAIALVIDDLVPVITRAVREAFADHGHREPAIFPVHAAQGARRDA
ncbi:galactokinase [Agromyces marinus]|uniref:Galactokinase n=1 Tax=Agromyces marinus TaxID=1389020 RepID=A0ABM8H4D9_9MICO|nr:galactokinase [Agromyces marinus]UIP59320.1 Galactokinase [Agromyces marinus]BDZ55658.1 galactokinase [Agromyces marinus]